MIQGREVTSCAGARVRKTVEEMVWKDVLTTICRSEDLTVPPLVGCCRWNRNPWRGVEMRIFMEDCKLWGV